jgi:hypothetical protein
LGALSSAFRPRGGSFEAVWREAHRMFNSIGFIFGILVFAFLCWALRSQIESDPEPIFLNLTFFAFAGQFIRTAEWIWELIVHGHMLPGFGTLIYLFIAALVVVILQARVMKMHMDMTTAHYNDLLKKRFRRLRLAHDHEIDRLAKVLLRITGVDFYPGGYLWLQWFKKGSSKEARAKSRDLAVSILPVGIRLKAKTLILKKTPQRRFYWWSYVIICLCSWILFVSAIVLTRKKF